MMSTQLESNDVTFLLHCLRVAREQFRNHAVMLRHFDQKQQEAHEQTGEQPEQVTGLALEQLAGVYDHHCSRCDHLEEGLANCDAVVLETEL